MSILTRPLPKSVLIGGQKVGICWDFRTWLEIEQIITSDMTDEEKGAEALRLAFGGIPEMIDEAVETLIWFYHCGKTVDPIPAEENEKPEKKTVDPDFSFDHDAGLIYAAFLSQYGIDLTEMDLHWWKFRALFEGLSGDHRLSEVRRCRTIKITKDMNAEQKKYYQSMKKLYALPLPEGERRDIDELTRALMSGGDVSGVLNGKEAE